MNQPAPDSAETHRLLEHIEAGDQGAFGQLFARHRDFLRQVIDLRMDRRVRARVDPSDVVQEAQLDAYQRLNGYLERRPMPFRLWLRKTAYERLLKVHRLHLGTRRRAIAREVALPVYSSADLAVQLLAKGSAPECGLDRAEAAGRIAQAIEQLPDADREIVLFRHFENLSNPEIGYLLGLDAATVSKRHGRALLRLRKLLLDGQSGEPAP